MSLTLVLFWVTYVGGVCAAIFNPIIGIALYILVYHLNPEAQWWGASVGAVGLRTSFTVALATGIGVLIRRPRLAPGARQFPLPYVLALLFGALAVASLAWGVDITERGLTQAEKIVKLLIFMFILVRCVRTPAQYQVVILAWIVGVTYVGYQAWGGVGGMMSGRLTTGLGGPDFAESSGLATHLVATLPLIGAMFFIARTWWARGFFLLAGALAVNTLVLTRTRNALLGLFLVTVTCVLSLPRGYRLKGLGAVLVGAFLSLQLVDPGWWNRMRSVLHYQHDDSASWRLEIWKAGLRMVEDYPFGIGLGNFHRTVMEYVPGLTYIRGAHNTLISCLAELGWVGLLLLAGVLWLTLRRLTRARRIARDLPDMMPITIGRWHSRFHLGWHAVALRAGFVGYLGCAMFTTRLFSEDFWLLIGFGLCLYNIAVTRPTADESAADPDAASVAIPPPVAAPGAPPHAAAPAPALPAAGRGA